MASVSHHPKQNIQLATNCRTTDLPDLTDADNVVMLDRWDGHKWDFLGSLKWMRISSNGHVQASIFPPKGQS